MCTLLNGNDALKFCHPAGNKVNCSGGSKPGWSSHWGSVQGFNVTDEGSLSLWNKKDKVKGGRGQKYSRPERRHITLTWKPVPGRDCFRTQYPRRQTWTVEVGIRAHSGKYSYSWACATTTSHTLSGTASHIANCKLSCELWIKSRGLKFSHKLRLWENPGTCLMNYVCHKHWTSGRKDDVISPIEGFAS